MQVEAFPRCRFWTAEAEDTALGKYVVATKREVKGERVSAVERIRGVAGAEVKGAANPDRVVVEMTPDVALELQRRYPDKLVVEPIIMHERSSSDDE